jgi:SAM-dependent methyltransferase
MNLEIGGGNLVTSGFVNLDPSHGTGPWQRLAQDVPWPTHDGSVEAIRASHVMEHIPAGQDRINVMNEAYRVLRKGGTFTIIVPLFVPGRWEALADPTHVSFWVEESFCYFDGRIVPQANYGMKLWQTVSFVVDDGWQGTWIGKKP